MKAVTRTEREMNKLTEYGENTFVRCENCNKRLCEAEAHMMNWEAIFYCPDCCPVCHPNKKLKNFSEGENIIEYT